MSDPVAGIRVLRIAGAILVILFGVWSGMRFYASREPNALGAGRHTLAAVRVPAGEASPPTQSDGGTDVAAISDPAIPPLAKIPQRLPDFSLSDRAGKTTSISAWGGKSLVLNFWATWCAPCRREIPLLESLYGAWRGRDVEIVGIAVDHRDQVAAYAEELKIPYPLLVGEQDALDVASQFGVESPVFPFTVFTDRRGDIVTLYVGELHQAQADLILSAVQQINDKRLALAEARRTIAVGLRALTARSHG